MNFKKIEKKNSMKRKKIVVDTLAEKGTVEKRPKKIKNNGSDSDSNENSVNDEDLDSSGEKSLKENSNNENSSEEGDDFFDYDDENQSEENSSSSKETELEKERNSEINKFQNLFRDVLEIFQKITPIEGNLIHDAIWNIKESFKTYDFNSVDFNLTENLFAYFENYSKLNAAVSRDRFLNAFNNCETLKTYINKSKLNVISLGGGPGTDMVGFLSAFQECREKPIPLFNFYVVDMWKRWESFMDIIKVLLREKEYGNTSKLFQDQGSKICLSFMEVDLMDKTPPKKYGLAITKADIVLLVRVLDSLNFKDVRPEDMLYKIAGRMKKDALLLLVDSGVKNYSCGLLKEIYFTDLGKFTLNYSQGACESNAQIAVYSKIC